VIRFKIKLVKLKLILKRRSKSIGRPFLLLWRLTVLNLLKAAEAIHRLLKQKFSWYARWAEWQYHKHLYIASSIPSYLSPSDCCRLTAAWRPRPIYLGPD